MIHHSASSQPVNSGNSEKLVSLLLKIMGGFAAIGGVMNAYLSNRYYVLRSGEGHSPSMCSLSANFNCDTVAQSRYAELFPGFPISLLATGVLFYIALLAFWPLANSSQRRNNLWAMMILALAGVVAGIPLMHAMATQIGSFCIFCIFTDIICIDIAALSWLALRKLSEGGSMRAPLLPIGNRILGAIVPVLVAYVAITPTPTDFEKRQQESAKLIYEQLKTAPIETVDTTSTEMAWGPKEAPVHILMMGDFQCGHCRSAFFKLKNLKNRFGDKIRWVLKEFPLSPQCNPNVPGGQDGHPHSCNLAKGAICAEKQGKFIEYTSEVYQRQEQLTSNSYQEIADQMGLDKNAFSQCVTAEGTLKELAAQIDEGISHKIQATPTLWINGRKSEGSLPMDVYINIVEDELKRVDR